MFSFKDIFSYFFVLCVNEKSGDKYQLVVTLQPDISSLVFLVKNLSQDRACCIPTFCTASQGPSHVSRTKRYEKKCAQCSLCLRVKAAPCSAVYSSRGQIMVQMGSSITQQVCSENLSAEILTHLKKKKKKTPSIPSVSLFPLKLVFTCFHSIRYCLFVNKIFSLIILVI